MPRKSKATKAVSPNPEITTSYDPEQEEEILIEPPTEINPYETLSIETTATPEQIKSAYRKAALKHHPDKASEAERETANKKFQEIAFAYAILSDERRRKRYDATGNTAETLHEDDEDFNWVDFFREQSAAMVSADMIEQVKREYQGSEEEKEDVLRCYEEHEGDMDALFESVMCSSVLEDEERFRKIIDEAIKKGEVEGYQRYTNESKANRKKRIKRAKSEEAEAMDLAEELGVKDKLFGNGDAKKGAKKGKKDSGEDALKALIQQRQKGRAETFFDDLEAKYGGGGGKKQKSKRKVDEPPEEMFQKNAKKAKGRSG